MSEALRFEAWLDQEYRYAAGAMLRSVSRTDLVKSRPGFGHSIRAAKGSIVASPVLASYDPDPDYFFHWYRDSAVVLEALRVLHADGSLGSEAIEHVRDFVRFGLSLRALEGRPLVQDSAWRTRVAPDFVKFLRTNEDLGAVRGANVVAETRVNPDGSLDISNWNRPQHDGAPLRALALLRWARSVEFDEALDTEAAELILGDLDFTLHHWREPSFDIWEEEHGHHYYTMRVSAAAMSEGADWLRSRSADAHAQALDMAADEITRELDGFWRVDEQHLSSRVLSSGVRSSKELDIAVILSAIHAEARRGPHGVRDPRLHQTLARLEEVFSSAYAINRNRPAGHAPALGRYDGDVYYSGGAYFFSTLGAAEFCFLAADSDDADALSWFERGDAYLATVRAYTPENGELSEQFDQNTGEQTSARHLAWSYAAFISTVAARRRALKRRA